MINYLILANPLLASTIQTLLVFNGISPCEYLISNSHETILEKIKKFPQILFVALPSGNESFVRESRIKNPEIIVISIGLRKTCVDYDQHIEINDVFLSQILRRKLREFQKNQVIIAKNN